MAFFAIMNPISNLPAYMALVADDSQKILVAYFSASGNTATIAQDIAFETGGNLFEIKPQNPYSEADLNWTDDNSHVVQEYLNESHRETPLEVVTPEN